MTNAIMTEIQKIALEIMSMFVKMNGANYIGCTYKNKQDEVSKYVLIADFSYPNACKTTKEILASLTADDFLKIASKGINNVAGVLYSNKKEGKEYLESGKLPKDGTKARQIVLDSIRTSKTLQTICNEMIEAFDKNKDAETRSASSQAQIDAYIKITDLDGNIIPSMKVSVETKNVHIYALAHSREVIEAGTYTESDKEPETLQKDAIIKYCKYELGKELPTTKYRNLKVTLEQLSRVKVLGTEILCG